MNLSQFTERFHNKTVRVYPKTTSQDNPLGAIVAAPAGEGVPLACGIQPGGGSLLVREYGERAKDMLALFVKPGDAAGIKPGDLVRVYAADKPDYRVVAAPARDSYIRVDLERL